MKKNVQIMSILNTTPDSLFGGILDGGCDGSLLQRLERAIRKMLEEGAHIIDVGGESTGPGSSDISADDEWVRIEPALKVLQGLRGEFEFKISVDTYKADVFKKALQYGVDILNDVTALRGDERMVKLVAGSGVAVCLMYAAQQLAASGNAVRTNTGAVQYDDVIRTIGDFLEERMQFAIGSGVSSSQIILDPGMGAFISGDHKYSHEILRRLGELKERFPQNQILIGASRKSFTGPNVPVHERLEGSLAAALIAAQNGADILRVHDVKPTKKVVEFLACYKQ